MVVDWDWALDEGGMVVSGCHGSGGGKGMVHCVELSHVPEFHWRDTRR